MLQRPSQRPPANAKHFSLLDLLDPDTFDALADAFQAVLASTDPPDPDDLTVEIAA